MKFSKPQRHLISTGKALYGDRWQTDLARDLGFDDGRRIRQWLSGDRPIPPDLWDKLLLLLRKKSIRTITTINTIENYLKMEISKNEY